jgi:hypothetical protein
MDKGAEKGLLKGIFRIFFISYDGENLLLHETPVPATELNECLLIAALRRRKQKFLGRERILRDIGHVAVDAFTPCPPVTTHSTEAN